MPYSRDYQAIPADECLRLVRGQQLGRIGLSMGALPVVLPVNYAVDGNRVVIRTGGGSKLAAAMRGAVVCMEVDEVDPDARSGWSVLVTGTASELTGDDAVRLAALLDPWSPEVGDHVIAIAIELVSGRRIVAPAVSPA